MAGRYLRRPRMVCTKPLLVQFFTVSFRNLRIPVGRGVIAITALIQGEASAGGRHHSPIHVEGSGNDGSRLPRVIHKKEQMRFPKCVKTFHKWQSSVTGGRKFPAHGKFPAQSFHSDSPIYCTCRPHLNQQCGSPPLYTIIQYRGERSLFPARSPIVTL